VAAVGKLVDRDLERIVVVSALHLTDLTTLQLVDICTYADFEDALSRRLWAAFEKVVAERDGWVPHWAAVVDKADVDRAEWQRYSENVPWVLASEVVHQAEKVADLAAYRRLRQLGEALLKAGAVGVPVDETLESTADWLRGIRSVVPERPLPRSLADIMAGEDEVEEWDWLVPGWIEKRDRVMLTGPEGFGKMTLMRQWAVQLAVGFHPWTGERVRPLVCLQLDLQDGRVRNEREFRRIARMSHVDPLDNLFAESWPQGLNILTSQRDRRDVESLIRSTRPDILFLGPTYRLAMKSDRREGTTAQGICDFVDSMRARYDCAVVLEAHSPHAKPGTAASYQPYGGREFMYWPDAGYGLAPDGDRAAKLRPFRGNRDRLQKIWPERLVWGEVWPWVPKGAPVGAVELRARSSMATTNTIPNDDPYDPAVAEEAFQASLDDPDAY